MTILFKKKRKFNDTKSYVLERVDFKDIFLIYM